MTDIEPAIPVVDAEQEPLPILTVMGELEDAHAVRTAIGAASDGFAKSIRVDLSDVTYLPSVVIGALFLSMKLAAEAGTVVQVAVQPGSVVEQILRITGMPHVVL